MTRAFIRAVCFLLVASSARSAVVYSGPINAVIPFSANSEVYVNLYTNTVATSLPGDYETSPWVMAFFGGSGIGTGPLVRPVVTGDVVAGSEQIANLSAGSVVDAMSRFSIGDAGFNGSETHTGPRSISSSSAPRATSVTSSSPPWAAPVISRSPASPSPTMELVPRSMTGCMKTCQARRLWCQSHAGCCWSGSGFAAC